MSINRNLATRSLFVFGSKIVRGAATFVLVLIVNRYYGPHEAGLYFLAITIVMFVSQVVLLGTPQACLKFIPELAETGRVARIPDFIASARWAAVLAAAGALMLIVSFGDSISRQWFNEAGLKTVLFCMAPILIFWPLIRIDMRSRQSRHDMTGVVYFENIFLPVGLLLASAGAAVAGAGLAVFAALVTSVYVLTYVVLAVTNPPEIGRFAGPGELFSGDCGGIGLRRLLTYSIPLMGVGFAQYAIGWSDTLMIGYFMDPSSVAIYNGAIRISLASTLLLYVVNTTFTPLISEYAARGAYDELAASYDRCIEYIIAFSLPVVFLVMYFSSPLMGWFGPDYVVGAVSLVVLMLGQLFNIAVGPVGYMLILSGRERVEVLNIAANVIMNIILNIILIPRWGIVGAATATAISLIAVNGFRLYQNARFFGIRWFNSGNFSIIGSVTISSAAAAWIASRYGELWFLLMPAIFVLLLTQLSGEFLRRAKADLETVIRKKSARATK